MTASLEGPRLKLNRAGKHLEDLEEAVSDFTQAELEKVTIEHQGGTRLWVIDEPGKVPPQLGPIISDVLHNLRSSLDFLATQLVLANKPRAGISDVGFPIFDNITEYVERGLPMIAKMSQGVRTAIEAAQPYHRPTSQWRTDRLLLLNRLNNSYKHSDFKLTALSIEGGGGWGIPDGLANNAGPLEGRTVLMAWPNEDPEVEVNWTFHLDVVFADTPWGDQRVVETLTLMRVETSQLIDTLAGIAGLS